MTSARSFLEDIAGRGAAGKRALNPHLNSPGGRTSAVFRQPLPSPDQSSEPDVTTQPTNVLMDNIQKRFGGGGGGGGIDDGISVEFGRNGSSNSGGGSDTTTTTTPFSNVPVIKPANLNAAISRDFTSDLDFINNTGRRPNRIDSMMIEARRNLVLANNRVPTPRELYYEVQRGILQNRDGNLGVQL